MSFQIIRDDITRVKADAIVDTANPRPVIGGGTDSAIYAAAGEAELLAERMKIGDIARGEAAATPAFGLDAKYIIHTVGPIWEGGGRGEFETLAACYENSLKLAVGLKCRSVAFPLISTGTYGFPKDKALQIAMSVIQPFVMSHSMTVILVVFDRGAFELSGSVIDNIREFVNDNYVDELRGREYASRRGARPGARSRRELEAEGSAGNVPYPCKPWPDMSMPCGSAAPSEEDGSCGVDLDAAPKASVKAARPEGALIGRIGKKIDIRKMIDNSEKTFQEKLFEIIDSRGLKNSEVYDGYISKQVFSKIQCDRNYHPNKYTAIALCLSLHLNVEETLDLIGRAGWTLSPSNKADLVVKGCIMNREFNVVNIDIVLFDFGCPQLYKIK